MREGNEQPGATFPASGRAPNTINDQPQGMQPRAVSPKVNAPADHAGHGQGQSMPGAEKGPAPAQLNDHSGH
jgi:cytochrome o ubiquinol oxidase subunit II